MRALYMVSLVLNGMVRLARLRIEILILILLNNQDKTSSKKSKKIVFLYPNCHASNMTSDT